MLIGRVELKKIILLTFFLKFLPESEELGCKVDQFLCRDGNTCIDPNRFCNGWFDCRDGSDEHYRNNSLTYPNETAFCRGRRGRKFCVVPSSHKSRRNLICEQKFKCNVDQFTCRDRITCIDLKWFCDGQIDCPDGSDKLDYRNIHKEYGKNVTFCRRGKETDYSIFVLSPYLVPQKHRLCAESDECPPDKFACKDGSQCLNSGDLCDSKYNCRDRSDEVTTDYNFGGRACFRSLTPALSLKKKPCKAAKESICDDVHDCVDGIDECLCDEDSRKDYVDSRCFRCLAAPSHVIPLSRYCDNVIDCPDLSDECLCKSSQRRDICSNIEFGERINSMRIRCVMKTKSSDSIPLNSVCDGRIDCDDGVDELFCRDMRELERLANTKEQITEEYIKNKKLPHPFRLLETTNHLCDGIYHRYDLSDEIDCSNRNYCAEHPLPKITTKTTCDKVDDCPNGRDEANCRHFYCNDGGNIKYLDQNQVCDGIRDCATGTDECQPGCVDSSFSNEVSLIKNEAIVTFVWIFSGMALIGCGSVAFVTTREIKKSDGISHREPRSTKHRKINKSLILSLSISDLLVAIYALIICIKSAEFEWKYCLVDREWRSSITCSVLGAMVVTGSEQSVFTMIMITIHRLYSVCRPTLIPNVKIVWVGLAVTWMLSIGLGVIPAIPLFEDYFVDNLTLMNSPLFTAIGHDEVEYMTSWLSLIHNGSIRESRHGITKWGKLRSLVGYLNPNITIAYEYGYYSTHAVCLPTFFPDPEKDAAWGYSFFLLLVNFLAFTFMLIAYTVMYRRVSRPSAAICSASNQEQREAQNAQMQRKLTLIVATDFFCWMPVCIMGFLQLGGVDIPKDTYFPTGLILIPINSALNPFLYSNLPEILWEKSKPLRNLIRSILPTCEIFKKEEMETASSQEEEVVSAGIHPGASGPPRVENNADGANENVQVTQV